MNDRRLLALDLLAGFTERTGLTGGRPPKRYLWTDAFAVCTLLGVGGATGHDRHTGTALRLIAQVHAVLGRHRPDDARRGWISGLAEAEGAAHPTAGGLRIGKPLPERGAGEPLNARLEWERDGQYFHYLTKWMHALDCAARATGQAQLGRWARELARRAHRAFTDTPAGGGPPRMCWKRSIDLARPLVAAMGQHDPLDGLVTAAQLEATRGADEPSLAPAMVDYAAMIDWGRLASGDPLGIGGLLADACRVAQLQAVGAAAGIAVEPLLDAALTGLRQLRAASDLRAAAARRLAFRELGLAIGLAALAHPAWRPASEAVRTRFDALAPYRSLRDEIEAFWSQPRHRDTEAWRSHADINDVMLATSLEPVGFLTLAR